MRIAIFGGAFDPVHLDHVRMAVDSLRFGYVDQVWMVPSPDRWDKVPQTPCEHRLAMLHIALRDYAGSILASDVEIHFEGYRGTYFLMNHLQKNYPEHSFHLLVGADSVENIPMWRDPKEYNGTNPNGEALLREFPLIVYPRKGYGSLEIETDFVAKGYPEPKCFLNNHPDLPSILPGEAASRILRTSLWSDSLSRQELPSGVWDYIESNHLYMN